MLNLSSPGYQFSIGDPSWKTREAPIYEKKERLDLLFFHRLGPLRSLDLKKKILKKYIENNLPMLSLFHDEFIPPRESVFFCDKNINGFAGASLHPWNWSLVILMPEEQWEWLKTNFRDERSRNDQFRPFWGIWDSSKKGVVVIPGHRAWSYMNGPHEIGSKSFLAKKSLTSTLKNIFLRVYHIFFQKNQRFFEKKKPKISEWNLGFKTTS